MVPAQQEQVLWELDLIHEEERDGVEALLAAAHVVAEDEVVALGREGAVLEESEQIVVLSVHIATDFQGCFELEKDWLGQEYFTRLKRVKIRGLTTLKDLLLNIDLESLAP